MPNLIYVKIDVTKILKEHLFAGKNGAKYLDVVLIPSSKSQYGDTHMAVQGLPKELRDQGTKGPIIGNAKEQDPKPASHSRPTPQTQEKEEDQIPF